MKRLKVGVVGIGFIGAAHVDAIRRVPYAEVVAVASSTPERRLHLNPTRCSQSAQPTGALEFESVGAKRFDGVKRTGSP